jgi:hypothetical protein
MPVSPKDIILTIIGFLLVAVMTPVGANYLFAVNSTFNLTGTTAPSAATYAAVYTMFNVLLPVLYIIGVALYFIPRIGKGE